MSNRFTQRATAGHQPAVDAQPSRRLSLTRAQLLARALAGAGTMTVGGVLVAGLPKLAVSQPSREQDVRVVEWLLAVEHLQAAFYAEAERRGRLTGEAQELAALVGRQERAHVEALERIAGASNSGTRPELDFGDTTAERDAFIAAAIELEEIAVAAFNGQLPNLTRPRVLTAMEIVSVEARHVGWARDVAGRNPAPRPADRPATQDGTRAAMEATGFVE